MKMSFEDSLKLLAKMRDAGFKFDDPEKILGTMTRPGNEVELCEEVVKFCEENKIV